MNVVVHCSLRFIVVLLLPLSLALATPAKEAPAKSVDLMALVSAFLLPAASDKSAQEWSWEPFAEQKPPPLKFGGRTELKEIKTFARGATAPLATAAGPLASQPWDITLLGNEAGIHTLALSAPPDKEFDVGLPALFDKHGIKHSLYKCDKYQSPAYGERIYEITAPDKKPAWLAHIHMEGSGGYSVDIKVFLSRAEADAEPGVVAECPPPGS